MLKKPYIKFYEIEHNSYYTLETSDTTFLVVESVLPYKRFLKNKEFTTAIKMLPLNSNLLYALSQVLKLNKIGESKAGEGVEVEEYFEELDVKAVRNELKQIVEEADLDNHRFDYHKPVHNETIKNLLLEGYTLLTTEIVGTYMRKHWLLRTDKHGVVRIVEATLGGKPASAKVVDIKFHTVNRNIIVALLNKLSKGAK